MKKVLFLILTVIIIACSSDDIEVINYDNIISDNEEIDSAVSVSKEGYLVFDSPQSLKIYMENISCGQPSERATRCIKTSGFISIAELDEQITQAKTRLDSLEDIDDLSDVEEMTEDEYNIMKAENLLFDDVLTHLVDTTLRICVEGRLYKITEQGTFSVDTCKADLLKISIEEFDPEIKQSMQTGQSISLNNDVIFTNSFSETNINSSEFQLIEKPVDDNTTKPESTESYTDNSFHTSYNVNTYEWKNHSVVQKLLDWLRGKDVSRENKFNKNRRVQVSVFDVNYAFYASAGIKVKMQKRKKFLGIPYWKLEKAEKIVIGFNALDGIMKYNNPRSYSSINPTMGTQWNAFTGALNGIQSKFFYGMYNDLAFIKDWTNEIICLIPEILPGDNNWKDKIGNELYKAPANAVYAKLKSLENKYIYSPIKRCIMPTDPKMAYLVWGNSSTEFNKEHPYITGVREYSNCKSKSVIFDRSFGFSIINHGVSGFLPSEFDIKKLDVFGAAYYDNQWKGIRFTNAN